MATSNGRFFSTAEAARRLKVSQRRVNQFIANDQLKAEKIGHDYLIREDDLKEFEKRDRPPGRPKGDE